MTKRNGPRYSDSKDFNEIHDSIVIGLSKKYESILYDFAFRVIKKKVSLADVILNFTSATVDIEKAIDPFNIPDLIIKGHYHIRYIGKLKITKESPYNGGKWALACPLCRQPYYNCEINGESKALGTAASEEEMSERIRNLGVECISGSVGLYNSEEHVCQERHLRIIIEVKSYIKSFGETMRQLQSYSDATEKEDIYGYPRDIICIASPDDRFKEEFEKQGFPFIFRPILIGDDKSTKKMDLLSFTNNGGNDER